MLKSQNQLLINLLASSLAISEKLLFLLRLNKIVRENLYLHHWSVKAFSNSVTVLFFLRSGPA
jgi:hypothetical protein